MNGYSTGMKQRVKLAQALVHDPRLVLLDEPTNGLDPQGRDEMLELIQRIGTEFGISILMPLTSSARSSASARSRRDRRWPPRSLRPHGRAHGATQVLAVEVEGDGDGAGRLLRKHNSPSRSEAAISSSSGRGRPVYDLIRDTVVEWASA